MPSLSSLSLSRLRTCHPKLIQIVMLAVQRMAFGVVIGWRGKEDQDAAVAHGLSDEPFPQSPHNHMLPDGTPCSVAVDLVPVSPEFPHGDWNHHTGFILLAAAMQAAAADLGIRLRHWPLTLANGAQDEDHWELDRNEYA